MRQRENIPICEWHNVGVNKDGPNGPFIQSVGVAHELMGYTLYVSDYSHRVLVNVSGNANAV